MTGSAQGSSAQGSSVQGDDAPGPPALPERLRRRLDGVFGDVLPEVTRDEVAGDGDDATLARDDEWLRANRPPHHDRD